MAHNDSCTGERVRTIAQLNDQLRQSGAGGHVYVTRGVAACGPAFVLAARRAIRAFEAFGPDNDPYGERDFGAFELVGRKLFWKIDYYDPTLTFASDDLCDPAKTARVLTIMLVEEY